MKKTTKSILAVLLAVLTVFSVAATFAFAAESDSGKTADEQPATVESQPAEEPVMPVPVVGKVKDIVKESILTDTIKLSWKKVSGASGYSVYMCNADKTTKFSKVGDVKTNNITVKKLAQGTVYHFKVAAYMNVNGKKYEGQATLKKTATNLTKVTGVSKVRSSDVVQIRWDKNSKATGYKIMRTSTESKNKEQLVKTINSPNTTTYTDKNVKLGRNYYYKVIAFRNANNTRYQSGYNGSVWVRCGLGAPAFSISSKIYTVNLSWKKNPYARGYDIYYSTDRNAKKYTKAGYTMGTSFSTRKLKANTKYYFRVVPVYRMGKTVITGTYSTKSISNVGKIYGKAPGSSYVEISISKQRMWCYKNGKLVVETPVVTGTRNSMDTPKGYFTIYSRARNTYLTGPGYSSFVEYWMAFSGGCGIHDASWRSSGEYGGNTYVYNGSHGCVNTPRSAVSKVWANTDYGTPVIIY